SLCGLIIDRSRLQEGSAAQGSARASRKAVYWSVCHLTAEVSVRRFAFHHCRRSIPYLPVFRWYLPWVRRSRLLRFRCRSLNVSVFLPPFPGQPLHSLHPISPATRALHRLAPLFHWHRRQPRP